jgi:hypothetical protein
MASNARATGANLLASLATSSTSSRSLLAGALIKSSKLTFRGHLQDSKQVHQQMKMASQLLTTNPGLIAVALVIRSRDGPRFVFHYPPRPTTETSQRRARFGTELDQSELDEKIDDEGDTDDSDLEDGGYQMYQAMSKLVLNSKVNRRKPNHVGPLEDDDHYDSPNGEHVVPWEHLFEFSTKDLESILTPSKAYHKKKFELTLDPLHFVAYPMHIREDRLWKKKKPKKVKKFNKEESETVSSEVRSVESKEKEDSSKAKATQTTSEDGDDRGGMTMFNVVFILNVPKDEADQRILEIYEHVIKKFNKALKHAQAQSDYVWKESEMILSIKEKAREDSKSSFATARANC